MTDVFIDHLTILLAPREFDSLPSYWTSNFTVLDGGLHTSLASRMKLIAFRDGTYIELFSWTGKPPPQPTHPWANRPSGILDFALSAAAPSTPVTNRARLLSALDRADSSAAGGRGVLGVSYGALQPGGRATPAGEKVVWETLHPVYGDPERRRLEAPFWCHDVTERGLRVPFHDAAATTHPCGATGVAQVDVLVPEERVREYAGLYEAVTGAEAREVGADFVLETRTPFDVEGRQRVVVRGASEEERGERGVGFGGFALRVSADGREGRLGEEGTAIRIRLVRD